MISYEYADHISSIVEIATEETRGPVRFHLNMQRRRILEVFRILVITISGSTKDHQKEASKKRTDLATPPPKKIIRIQSNMIPLPVDLKKSLLFKY